MLEHLVHVDALRVEQGLLLSRLGGGLAQQAVRDPRGLHDDRVLGQRRHHRGQVKVHLAHRQDQAHLEEKSETERWSKAGGPGLFRPGPPKESYLNWGPPTLTSTWNCRSSGNTFCL